MIFFNQNFIFFNQRIHKHKKKKKLVALTFYAPVIKNSVTPLLLPLENVSF